jgi:hypothetical protein
MNKKTCLYIVPIILMLTFFFSGCDSFWLAEEFLQRYEVEAGTEVEVYNRNGRVNVRSWDGEHLEVSAVKKSWMPGEINLVEIKVTENKNFVVRTESLERNPRVSVNYEILVPSGISVKLLETSNGNINVQGAAGNVTAVTSNGSIKIVDVDGFVTARTSNGKIEVSGVSGLLGLRTSNGNIEAEAAGIGKDVEVTSSNGSISLLIASAVDADVEARTSNGKITIYNLQFVSSEMDSNYMKGRLGSGGSRLFIKTSNGSIKLDRL